MAMFIIPHTHHREHTSNTVTSTILTVGTELSLQGSSERVNRVLLDALGEDIKQEGTC